jgi:hypothetical protein
MQCLPFSFNFDFLHRIKGSTTQMANMGTYAPLSDVSFHVSNFAVSVYNFLSSQDRNMGNAGLPFSTTSISSFRCGTAMAYSTVPLSCFFYSLYKSNLQHFGPMVLSASHFPVTDRFLQQPGLRLCLCLIL